MRRWLVASCMLGSVGMLGLITQANAQDFETPTLRGSSPYIPAPPKYMRWQGFYFGGQIGYASAKMDFSGATESLIAYMLRNTALENESRPSEWGVLGKAHHSGTSYGGFVGYNFQFSDAVVGIDLHYNGTNLLGNAPVDPIGRITTVNGIQYDVDVNGSASMRVTDYGSIRARAGWVAGNLLPYATLGLAVGRADVVRSAQISGTQNPNPAVPCSEPGNSCVPFFSSSNDAKKAAFIYGWSAGGGVDIMVMPNMFVRAEYEFLSFSTIQSIKSQISTARLGAGFKF
jgi:opacity protein-like surface antigen